MSSAILKLSGKGQRGAPNANMLPTNLMVSTEQKVEIFKKRMNFKERSNASWVQYSVHSIKFMFDSDDERTEGDGMSNDYPYPT